MRNLIINIIIAIVCFTSGYALYPSINDAEFETTLTNEVTDENNGIEDIVVVKATKTPLELKTNSNPT